MCIFARLVSQVGATRIFVAPAKQQRQITVYENRVGGTEVWEADGIRTTAKAAASSSSASKAKAKKGGEKQPLNAMILPCPLRAGSEVQLIDLSLHRDLFSKLDECFPRPRTKSASKGVRKSVDDNEEDEDEPLEVHVVGGYSVSVAPTLRDLRRVDAKTFAIAEGVEALLTERYAEGFGFVICAFDPAKDIEPHPIGYVHDRLEPMKLFVPCVHEHGHGTKRKEHFDHSIFSIDVIKGESSEAGEVPEELAIKYNHRHFESKVEGTLARCQPIASLLAATPNARTMLRRRVIKGLHANEDLVFELLPDGDPFGTCASMPTVEDAAKNPAMWRDALAALSKLVSDMDAHLLEQAAS
jgi:hypothetical protein